MFIIEQMESEVKPEPFRAIQIRPCRQSTKEAPIQRSGLFTFPFKENMASPFG